MKKEDRELLVRDLCARLPYNTVISVTNDDRNTIQYLVEEDIKDLRSTIYYSGNTYKPYLFPLSSMTEHQRMELNSLLPVGVSLQINSNNFTYFEINTDLVCCFQIEFWDKFFDWLNKNHFDYHGIIPMGLALDATGLNIY